MIGCNSTKYIDAPNLLLQKNQINIEGNENVNAEDFENIIKQTPNRMMFGLLPVYLYLNNYGNGGKDSSKVRNWFKNTGEEPAIIDSVLTSKSKYQIQLFLNKIGHYNAVVEDSLGKHKSKQKAVVYYNVSIKAPYLINKITFKIDDQELYEPLKKAFIKTLLKPGAKIDQYVLSAERERMTKAMKNKGFYNFSKEYVTFELDTTIDEKKVNVKQIIENPKTKYISKIGLDSLVESTHSPHTVRNIYLNAEHRKNIDFGLKLDTIDYENIKIIYHGKLEYRKELLIKNIFVKKDEFYSLENTEYTYTRLSGLKTFKFINIRYEKNYEYPNSLDCYIMLSASQKKSFTIETQGTHRGGNLGVAATAITRNKNSFRGAEVFEVKLKGGLEAQSLTDEEKLDLAVQNEGKKGLATTLFNTLEYGAEISLFVPELVYPKKSALLPRYTEPKTNIGIGYNYQKRPFYDRWIFNVGLKYHWRLGQFHKFVFSPIDLSYIDIEKDSVFAARLKEIDNTFLSNSYSAHLIPSSSIGYFYSNQDFEKNSNFMYLKLNLESAGNALKVLSQPLKLNQNLDGNYQAFDVPFSQYVKVDFDLRFFEVLTQHSTIVYRGFGGIAVPLSNNSSIPFEKSFFAGGSNNQRAWTARSLGPGSINDTISYRSFDQIGDVLLGANVEYRFDILKMVEGAVFIDAGNIWIQQKDNQRVGSDFDFKRFYKEIAIGAGIGARLDFSFFIVRLDAGIKIRDPSLPEDERWIHQSKNKYNTYYSDFLSRTDSDKLEIFESNGGYQRFNMKFNLGIDYPF